MLHKILPSSMGTSIPTNLTTALGPQIQRHFIPMLLEHVLIELFEDTACITAEHPTDLIKALHLIELLEADNDLVVDWHTAPDEPGVAALRDHRQVVGVAVFQDLAELRGRRGQQHQFGVPVVHVQEAPVERLHVVLGGQYV